LSGGADSVLRVLDRRGGGSAGFAFESYSTGDASASLAFSSSSCSSFADLKDKAGEVGVLLSNDVDSRRWEVAERLDSCDFGPTWVGEVGLVRTLVFRAANWIGFCLIGGDFNGRV
jgi:hypothetical protein